MTDAASPGSSADRPRFVVMSIGEASPQVRVDVSGMICSVRVLGIGGAPACSYTLADGTGQLDLLFLGRIQVPGLENGCRCRAEGMVAIRDDRHVIWNPRYRIEPADRACSAPVVDGDRTKRRILAVSRSPALAGQIRDSLR